jgi:hypothetical protein
MILNFAQPAPLRYATLRYAKNTHTKKQPLKKNEKKLYNSINSKNHPISLHEQTLYFPKKKKKTLNAYAPPSPKTSK